ncbi:MAG: hypothetical protein K0Q69_3195 [Devosia sp.]|jgi:hypothetical protein|nr:hypothetical protein [Devosia sp.]
MSDTTTIRAKVLRDFNDAGSQSRFTKDKIVPMKPSLFDNYRAAGLVEAAPAEIVADAPAEPPVRTRASRN